MHKNTMFILKSPLVMITWSLTLLSGSTVTAQRVGKIRAAISDTL